MAKRKAGLQKKISSIFDGVPVPTKQEQEQAADAAPQKASYPIPKTPSPPPASSAVPRPRVQNAPDQLETPVKSYPKLEKQKERPPRRIDTPAPSKHKTLVVHYDDENPKQKKLMALVGFLAVAFVVIFARNFIPAGSTPRPTDATEGPAETAVAPPLTAEIKIDWEKPPPFPELPYDPMARPKPEPVVVEPTPPPPEEVKPPEKPDPLKDLVVKGIVHSADRPAALIGDIMVHEGEKVLGCTVLKISRSSVDFEKDGKKWTQQVQRSKHIKDDKEGEIN